MPPTASNEIRAERRNAARRGEDANRRRRGLAGLALTGPLLVFLLAFFAAPVGNILLTGIHSPDVATAMPRTVAALEKWRGTSRPGDDVFAAVIRDLRTAYAARTVADAAERLNRERPGFRSLLMKTARIADELDISDPVEAVVTIDAAWNEIETWRALKRAGEAWTPRFLAAALDMEMDWKRGLELRPPDERVYLSLLGRTLWMALVVTVVCLAAAYPLAHVMARTRGRLERVLVFLVLLPFWMSVLVRTVAWMVILQKDGIANDALQWLDVVDAPLSLIFNRAGVYISMVYVLLPFAVLPMYAVMRGIAATQVQAAESLGARPLAAFFTVYLPQSAPGVAAAAVLVFIVSVGFYVTPALVGGPQDQMIGSVIAHNALTTANWSMAAALSLVLLGVVVALYPLYSRAAGPLTGRIN
ncbi:MAG: ABC transporter permease [Gammaproteobacteria bacterium]|nr:ABC transporter permease [Gammaproteobacteria bacterium]